MPRESSKTRVSKGRPPVQTFYKVRDPETGLFWKGGESLHFHKVGKTWKAKGHVASAFANTREWTKRLAGRYHMQEFADEIDDVLDRLEIIEYACQGVVIPKWTPKIKGRVRLTTPEE